MEIKTKKINRLKKNPSSSVFRKNGEVDLNITQKKYSSASSPYVVNLNELIKKQKEEKNTKKISAKTYYKENLYKFWTDKDDDFKNLGKIKNSDWEKLNTKIKNAKKAVSDSIKNIPEKIKTAAISLIKSKSRNRIKEDIIIEIPAYQRILNRGENPEIKPLQSKIKKKTRKIFTKKRLNQLAIVNLAQLFIWLLIKILESIKKSAAYTNNLIPASIKEKVQSLKENIAHAITIRPPQNWRKALGFFMAVAFVLTVPIQAMTYYGNLQGKQNKILSFTMGALGDLKSGGMATTAFELDSAQADFKKAEENFTAAEEEVNQINLVITNIIRTLPNEGKTFKSGEALIMAGKNISEISQSTAEIVKILAADDTTSLTDKITAAREQFQLISPKLDLTAEFLSRVEIEAIPEGAREAFLKVQGTLPLLQKSLEELDDLARLSLNILGQDRTKRYLFVFQNNNEIRPTGGFIGSFALVDIDRGKIKKMEIPAGGSYDLQGGLKQLVVSPEPLHLINPQWQFQDANWFPDFPASAKKIIWFYEKSGGPTVDGVVAINTSLMKDLLKITGSIAMPEYDKTIDENNFIEETQKEVEIDYKVKDKPKQFIADLAPKLIDRIFNLDKEKIVDIIPILRDSLRKKNIILYATDPAAEQSIAELGWAGEIKSSPLQSDYLYVVNTNISGGKTDLSIKQKINHQSTILDDGSIINRLTITRTHTGTKDNIFTKAKNIDYLRIYVPEGSTLESANGFSQPQANLFVEPDASLAIDTDLKDIEGDFTTDLASGTTINNEFGKTVFANWLELEPGETKTVTLEYKLPFLFKITPKPAVAEDNWIMKIKKEFGFYEEKPNLTYYAFLNQKQPGVENIEFTSTLALPQNLQVVFKYPDSLTLNSNNLLLANSTFDRDQSYGLILKEK
jgi:hypothetical protein